MLSPLHSVALRLGGEPARMAPCCMLVISSPSTLSAHSPEHCLEARLEPGCH